ncbi:alpha/beta hydrolase [Rhodococcus sp. ACS1]|uniref:Acetyl esterase/lipase n=1 Tax=Rhodococcus koreensis TaxID=99653 RepID=A0A1H4MY02_9NOCA|nr:MULTISPECIES: alpha/beta hydrolase [Rhodococcus]PBC52351.1 alpha/beta hydrolase [Rhodococcus sp. ACS1]QSE84329.1 alpha/beta hydrolase [Rhodococcus koreensis]SEB88060.1 Acetyl esterase/lipase [Rhodococcus koreensis]
MTRGFVLRQAVGAALAANALRPLPGAPTSVVAFFSGWLTTELAPHLLAVTAADAAQHAARHGTRTRSDRVGLALAAASAAGLAAVIATGRGAGAEAESALVETLGENYTDRDHAIDHPGRPVWRQLLNPFWMRNKAVTRVRNLAYGPGGRRARLDIYHRQDLPSKSPVLLQIHGGGWVIGNKDQQGLPLMLEMASRGWVCAAVNYPLSPKAKWPEHLIAIKQALAWLREHVEEYGGNPDFIAVTGGSAGGHLAAMVGLTANDSRLQPGFEDVDTSVQACVPYYGVYDFAGDTGIKAVLQRVHSGLMPMVLGKNAAFPDDYRAASPLAHLRADAPPFFVIHGTSDSLIPVAEARIFVDELRQVSGNPVVYAELKGAQHAFDVFPSIRSISVTQAVGRFLEWSRSATTDVPAAGTESA